MNRLSIVILLTLTAAFCAYAEETQKEALNILTPPKGAQTRFLFYKPTQYLHIKEYNIHVFGTKTVTPWMMHESYELIRQMVGSLKNAEDRKKFSGHEAFLITNADPDLTIIGSFKGHRNTGGKSFSVFNEALVCVKAANTFRNPDSQPVYRGWNTPVHEFGHSIENTLGLKSKSDKVFKKNIDKYNPKVKREYFAWATQTWFASSRHPSRSRKDMPKWKYEYFSTVFSEENDWCPGREPRP